MAAGRDKTGTLSYLISKVKRERRDGDAVAWSGHLKPQSPNTVTHLLQKDLSQTVPLTRDKAFKYMRLPGPISLKTP